MSLYVVSSNIVIRIIASHSASCFVLFVILKQKICKNRCCCCFQLGKLNNPMFWKELFIRFAMRVLSERSLICVCASFPISFTGWLWHLIVSISDHCLTFYFRCIHVLPLLFYYSVYAWLRCILTLVFYGCVYAVLSWLL